MPVWWRWSIAAAGIPGPASSSNSHAMAAAATRMVMDGSPLCLSVEQLMGCLLVGY
jgi:hypothetical protein